MAEFFDARAAGYDAHMYEIGCGPMYRRLAEAVPQTAASLRILDLGCGTGLELELLLPRVPNARVTCVDLSENMLQLLRERYEAEAGRLDIRKASCLTWEYPEDTYDIVLSSQTMHHLEEGPKVELYRRILRSLRSGGCYLEADFMVTEPMMQRYRRQYEEWKQAALAAGDTTVDGQGRYHLDLPFTPPLQQELLQRAGFSGVTLWEEHLREEGSWAILRADRVVLRSLRESDLPALSEEFRKMGWQDRMPVWQRYLREQDEGRRQVFVAEAGGMVAGYVTLLPHALEGAFVKTGWPEIADLNVMERFRRQGIGNRLLEAAEQAAAEYADTVCLGVGVACGYGAAQRLYIRRGYQFDGSGVWYQGNPLPQYSPCSNDDSLILYLSRRL